MDYFNACLDVLFAHFLISAAQLQPPTHTIQSLDSHARFAFKLIGQFDIACICGVIAGACQVARIIVLALSGFRREYERLVRGQRQRSTSLGSYESSMFQAATLAELMGFIELIHRGSAQS